MVTRFSKKIWEVNKKIKEWNDLCIFKEINNSLMLLYQKGKKGKNDK